MDKYSALRHYFKYDSFKTGQERLIDALLSGQDVFGIMPTGAGKSICFQLPALLLPGITLVISPLISLMKDQVDSLIKRGIPAAYINSSLTEKQISLAMKNAAAGKYKLIYVSPERLQTPSFINLTQRIVISMVCVDEAHCVSQWGLDFRPAYVGIKNFISLISPRPIVAAFTATATDEIKNDVIELVGLDKPCTVVTGFDRPNLFFDVIEPENKIAELTSYIKYHPDDYGIVYCSTRKAATNVCNILVKSGVNAGLYHGALTADERKHTQWLFNNGKLRVIVATNAFGMGIDKPDVRFVIHYNLPCDIESYYQEAGRAGRDGAKADCILYFDRKDIETQKYFIDRKYEDEEEIDEAQKKLRLERLDRMLDYCCFAKCCRRFLLEYFGEEAKEKCCFCGFCSGSKEYAPLLFSPDSEPVQDDPELLTALKSHRQKTAMLASVPEGAVLSNKELSLVARVRPTTFDDLTDRCGLTREKARKYGAGIFKIIKLHNEK